MCYEKTAIEQDGYKVSYTWSKICIGWNSSCTIKQLLNWCLCERATCFINGSWLFWFSILPWMWPTLRIVLASKLKLSSMSVCGRRTWGWSSLVNYTESTYATERSHRAPIIRPLVASTTKNLDIVFRLAMLSKKPRLSALRWQIFYGPVAE